MIEILLMILKILGILLLVMIGLVLLLAFLILFVPVFYRLEADCDDAHSRIEVKGSWLLFFRFHAGMLEKKFSFGVRVLGFPVIGSNKKKSRKSAANGLNGAPVKPQESERIDPVQKKEQEHGADGPDPSEKPQSEQNSSKDPPQDNEPLKNPQRTEEMPEEGEPKKWKFCFWHPAELYGMLVSKWEDFLEQIQKKYRQLRKNLRKLLAEITDEENKAFVLFILQETKKLLKHILPRKHRIYLHLGMEDPSLTGEILGAYSVIKNALGLHVILEPEFEKKVLEVKACMKGRIQLLQLVIIGIRVYFNKTTRKFLRRK